MPTNTNIDEDEIIAQGLLKVRAGLVVGDWSAVSEGYADIAGEVIMPPDAKPKSRLEKIREMMGTAEVAKAPQEKTVKQLTEELLAKGHTAKELKGKKKSDLASLLDDNTEEVLDDEDGEIDVTVEKLKGGKRFATEGFQVISTGVNKAEVERNKKIARKKEKLPRSERAEDFVKRYDPNDDSRDVGYHDKPKRPPEGR